jgi:aminoglycoside phosphotransferase (APT) family kinase protein
MIHLATKNNNRLKRIRHSVDSEIKKTIANKELIISKYIDGDKFVDELTLALQKRENFDRNLGLVHGDYRSKNLIFNQQSDEVEAVIDFEWYFFGPTLYDLGLMLVEWSCPDRQDYFDKEILEAILSGYSEGYGQKVELNEEIKFWMYYSALSDATTFLLRRAQNSSSSEKIKIGSFMYQKALMARDYE